jgi:hypothetical protein
LSLLDDTRIEGDDDVDPDSVTEAVPVFVVLIDAVAVTDCEGDDIVEYVKWAERETEVDPVPDTDGEPEFVPLADFEEDGVTEMDDESEENPVLVDVTEEVVEGRTDTEGEFDADGEADDLRDGEDVSEADTDLDSFVEIDDETDAEGDFDDVCDGEVVADWDTDLTDVIDASGEPVVTIESEDCPEKVEVAEVLIVAVVV